MNKLKAGALLMHAAVASSFDGFWAENSYNWP